MTNIYLVPDSDLLTDTAITTFRNFYDGSFNIFPSILLTALNDYEIDFIESSTFIKTFTYQDANTA